MKKRLQGFASGRYFFTKQQLPLINWALHCLLSRRIFEPKLPVQLGLRYFQLKSNRKLNSVRGKGYFFAAR